MPRSFCILGVFNLFVAFILLLITSISLPYLSTVDIINTRFQESASIMGVSISQIRFGIWTYCYNSVSYSSTTCGTIGDYSPLVQQDDGFNYVIIERSWTRRLAVHPLATAVAFVALFFSFSTHLTLSLIAFLLAFLASALTLVAFGVDIALYVHVKYEMRKLNSGDNTLTGPGLWLTFISFILLILAGFTICFGRRREGTNNRLHTPKPSFFELGRFRRNGDAQVG